ncbi:MAG: tRNA-dihydrouridine synthase family protein, partial [Patescibacteria group bacterium]|nr:tRNA-dihydrouridine synthase family protein [Patescibacteria group bacterium]
MSFWNVLQKPLFVLAPMADVTDAAFRRIIARYGKPPVMWSEFVSADGLALAPPAGKKKLLADLLFTENERPIVAQFFTGDAAHMEEAANLAQELGFDGIDINMGCPDRAIERQHAGAAMIKDPVRAKAVIEGALRGAGGLPVSVKTRMGYNTDELDKWLPHLLETGIVALTLHARTRKEMSAVPAHWEAVTRAVTLRDKHNPAVLILGNGDTKDLQDAKAKTEETRAD